MHSPRAFRSARLAFFAPALLCGLLFAACSPGTSAPASTPGEAPAAAPAPPAEPRLPDPVPGPDGKVRLSDAEWRARLTPEQFKILRGADTERPFSCPLWKISDKPGVYHCAGCGLALFRSTDKFDSGTGWPSFTHPIAADRIAEKEDRSHGMIRVETLCARCDGHLGHVFPDGPPPGGRRYCINGTGLRFEPADTEATQKPNAQKGGKAQP